MIKQICCKGMRYRCPKERNLIGVQLFTQRFTAYKCAPPLSKLFKFSDYNMGFKESATVLDVYSQQLFYD